MWLSRAMRCSKDREEGALMPARIVTRKKICLSSEVSSFSRCSCAYSWIKVLVILESFLVLFHFAKKDASIMNAEVTVSVVFGIIMTLMAIVSLVLEIQRRHTKQRKSDHSN